MACHFERNRHDVNSHTHTHTHPQGTRTRYDLEGIAIDPSSNKYFVVDERGPALFELSTRTRGALLRRWDLSTLVTDYNRTFGFEVHTQYTQWCCSVRSNEHSAQRVNHFVQSLLFLANSSHIEGGTFLLGLQRDGTRFELQLPLRSSNTSTAYTLIAKHTLTSTPPCDARQDCLAALAVNARDQRLYAAFGETTMRIAALEGDAIESSEVVPGGLMDVEGFVFVGIECRQRLIVVVDAAGVGSNVYSFNITCNNGSTTTSTSSTTTTTATTISSTTSTYAATTNTTVSTATPPTNSISIDGSSCSSDQLLACKLLCTRQSLAFRACACGTGGTLTESCFATATAMATTTRSTTLPMLIAVLLLLNVVR